MALAHPEKRWSYADYLALPEDGRRFEVLEGELIDVTPAPSSLHQWVLAELFGRLYQWSQSPEAAGSKVFSAPLDVVLRAESPARVVQPDLLVVRPNALARWTAKGLEGPPDVVIEVASPSTLRRDVLVKRAMYAEHGVRTFWLVRPEERRVEGYEAEQEASHPGPGRFGPARMWESHEDLRSPTLPGFVVPVAALFPGEDFPA